MTLKNFYPLLYIVMGAAPVYGDDLLINLPIWTDTNRSLLLRDEYAKDENGIVSFQRKYVIEEIKNQRFDNAAKESLLSLERSNIEMISFKKSGNFFLIDNFNSF